MQAENGAFFFSWAFDSPDLTRKSEQRRYTSRIAITRHIWEMSLDEW
jgi:hypothetical protein